MPTEDRKLVVMIGFLTHDAEFANNWEYPGPWTGQWSSRSTRYL